MAIVRRATTIDFMEFADLLDASWVVEDKNKPIALGGFFEHAGETWAYFDVKPDLGAQNGMRVVRAVYSALKERGGIVFVNCDKAHDQAHRLLRTLGFRQTLVTQGNLRVWKWQY